MLRRHVLHGARKREKGSEHTHALNNISRSIGVLRLSRRKKKVNGGGGGRYALNFLSLLAA